MKNEIPKIRKRIPRFQMGNSLFSENGMVPYVNELIDSSEFSSSEVVNQEVVDRGAQGGKPQVN